MAIEKGDLPAVMEAVIEEKRQHALIPPMKVNVAGGTAKTNKIVAGQKKKHLTMFNENGGQWVVDNVKCHYCAKCYSSKAKRDDHHTKFHEPRGDAINEYWTTVGDEVWVGTFKRS